MEETISLSSALFLRIYLDPGLENIGNIFSVDIAAVKICLCKHGSILC